MTVASALGVVAFVTACGGSHTAQDQRRDVPGGAQGGPLQSNAAVNVASLPANLSDYQRKILADGVLTTQEYQQAAFDVVRCHKEHGARIGGYPHFQGEQGTPEPWWSARGQFMYSPAYPKDDPLAEQNYHTCEDEYFTTISAFWTDYIAPSVQEMQEARDLVAKCLRDEGIDVPAHPSTQELVPVTGPRRMDPQVSRCLRLGADHIGMPSFVA